VTGRRSGGPDDSETQAEQACFIVTAAVVTGPAVCPIQDQIEAAVVALLVADVAIDDAFAAAAGGVAVRGGVASLAASAAMIAVP